jgi:hypothetical protein
LLIAGGAHHEEFEIGRVRSVCPSVHHQLVGSRAIVRDVPCPNRFRTDGEALVTVRKISLAGCVLQPCQLLAAGGSVERALFHPIGSDGEGQPCRLKPLRLSTAPAAVSFLIWRNESPKGSR